MDLITGARIASSHLDDGTFLKVLIQVEDYKGDIHTISFNKDQDILKKAIRISNLIGDGHKVIRIEGSKESFEMFKNNKCKYIKLSKAIIKAKDIELVKCKPYIDPFGMTREVSGYIVEILFKDGQGVDMLYDSEEEAREVIETIWREMNA